MGKVRLAREQEQQELVVLGPSGALGGWRHRPRLQSPGSTT